MAPLSSKKFLDIQANIEYGFTVKRVLDMIKTYSFIGISELCDALFTPSFKISFSICF